MTTIKRYTNMRQSASSGGASPKGSKNNPYTEEEFNNIPAENWKGGYVEGIGYVGPGVVVTPSSEDPSDPFSDLFSDLFSNGDSDHGSAGGQTGGGGYVGGGGHIPGNGGNSGNGGTPTGGGGNNNNVIQTYVTYIIKKP